jgi:glutathione S-transferase
VLTVDGGKGDRLTETIVVTSYLADQHPEAGLIPARNTIERAKVDQLLAFVATEIAQKHIPLMRKLLTEEGATWTRNKLVTAYKVLDDLLSDGRPFITGNQFTVVDAYVWATMWHERSGADIGHLKNLFAWKARIDERPSVRKAIREEAAVVAQHAAKTAA